MKLVVLDFETEFGDDYTLSKMTTESYVRDPRFKAHGAAVKWSPSVPARWYDEKELRFHLQNTDDWNDTFLICHHAAFDGLILNHHYGVRPKFWGDTLSMARYALGNHLSASLEAVRKHFGMPSKSTPYNLFKGKKWHELSPAVQRQVADGAVDEVESIWRIFGLLVNQIPQEELTVIDTTIRMFTEPCLRANVPLLGEIWQRENTRKIEMMQSIGVTSEELQSPDKFAALLREAGVEPGTKPSPKDPDNKQIYAFAKTDQFMRDLLEDEDPHVQALAMARLGVKSTAVQTRAETLGYMAQRGPLCVYLNMYGAHTRRWSGGDGCLAADTVVVVFDAQKGICEKRIVDVLLDDLVWDGEEFVSHEGVAFQGYAEVIEHDGVKGTPDHQVFTEKGTVTLGEARKHGMAITPCPRPK